MGVAVDSKTGDVYRGGWRPRDRSRCSSRKRGAAASWKILSAQNLTPSEVQLSAKVDPEGADTHYYFQYGTVDCVTRTVGAAPMCPPAPGAISAARSARRASSATLQGLRPEHHLLLPRGREQRVREARRAQRLGPSNAAVAPRELLADGRAWELVSPPEKDGASIEPISQRRRPDPGRRRRRRDRIRRNGPGRRPNPRATVRRNPPRSSRRDRARGGHQKICVTPA